MHRRNGIIEIYDLVWWTASLDGMPGFSTIGQANIRIGMMQKL
jgi:hypothetical protein